MEKNNQNTSKNSKTKLQLLIEPRVGIITESSVITIETEIPADQSVRGVVREFSEEIPSEVIPLGGYETCERLLGNVKVALEASIVNKEQREAVFRIVKESFLTDVRNQKESIMSSIEGCKKRPNQSHQELKASQITSQL